LREKYGAKLIRTILSLQISRTKATMVTSNYKLLGVINKILDMRMGAAEATWCQTSCATGRNSAAFSLKLTLSPVNNGFPLDLLSEKRVANLADRSTGDGAAAEIQSGVKLTRGSRTHTTHHQRMRAWQRGAEVCWSYRPGSPQHCPATPFWRNEPKIS